MISTYLLLCRLLPLGVILALTLAACTPSAAPSPQTAAQLTPAARGLAEGEKPRVVATTSIVADVVAQVGGDAIDLVTLLPLGADPHAYTPTPQDLRTLNQADVIFINGLGLEEALMPVLGTLDSAAPVIEVNAAVTPLAMDGVQEGHAHGAGDPHTWFDVANVILWTGTIRDELSRLDPAHASGYAAAAKRYAATLTELDAEIRARIDTLPQERRKLVSDHAEFNYFAHAYGFEVIGAVIPALSTMAEPSAQQLAALHDQIAAAGAPAIFVGTTVNPRLEEQLAQDLGIEVVTLYTASLSPADGPAATYVDLMRHTVESIVAALGRHPYRAPG